MVGPGRTGGDEAEAAGGDLRASKRERVSGAWTGAGAGARRNGAHLVDALGVEVCARSKGGGV